MTTSKITESAIETFAIELLEKHSYQYIYCPDIAPDSENESTPPSGGRGASGEADNKLSEYQVCASFVHTINLSVNCRGILGG